MLHAASTAVLLYLLMVITHIVPLAVAQINTLWTVLEETDLMWIPVKRSWRLNERHYGALQGETSQSMRARWNVASLYHGCTMTLHSCTIIVFYCCCDYRYMYASHCAFCHAL